MWTVRDLLSDKTQQQELLAILQTFDIRLRRHPSHTDIPASYWGSPEAGIEGDTVHVRDDTPAHSLLHEACHLICMGSRRRATVVRDAGGEDKEEAAVCYLQLCLAHRLSPLTWQLLAMDMDDWGYSFPTGSTGKWFLHDADDARDWLVQNGFSAWLIQEET
ncbi:MAG: hypothetical protein AB8F65_01765 [Woeseiaceae bacterium]